MGIKHLYSFIYFILFTTFFRTVKDIQVLDHCEISPMRTKFVENLGQGAFSKVQKAKLKDGLEYFDLEKSSRSEMTVAIKKLRGKRELLVHIK